MVGVSHKGTGLSAEMQAFVSSCCDGIHNSAKLRQRLLDEQIELFDKKQGEYDAKARLDAKKLEDM